jgi:DNA polymerase III delta' subunit
MKITGHEPQRSALAGLAREERLPSSLLFCGPVGVGKRLVARELATGLLCNHAPLESAGGCGVCSACNLVKVGNHPDLHVVECGGEGISVDDLRHTLERLSLRPFLGTRKVAILNDADELSVVGANILLKTLEEPRPENFFILIAATPSRLPQTVLSRCQRWFFDRLESTQMETILKVRGASEEELHLIPLADGSLNTLASLRDRPQLGEEVLAVLECAWRGDHSRTTQAASEWASDKAGIRERLACLRLSIRHKLLQSGNDVNAAAVWSNALQRALDVEYLVLERHVNPTLALCEVLKSCDHSLANAYQTRPNSHPPLLGELIRF